MSLFYESIGLIAACLTTFSFLPQAVLVLRTRNTDGLSATMYAMFTCGVGLWAIYGALTGSLPVLLANIVTFLFATCIFTIKLHNMAQARKRK